MNLQLMFINSLYLLGIVVVVSIITELIMTTQRKMLAMKAFKKAIKSGQFETHIVKKEDE